MKRFILLIPIFGSLIILTGCGATSSKQKKDALSVIHSKNFKGKMVVMELFTSQGCSSCPPADKLVGSYSSEPNILTLSFHVDYWDRLGWKDAFSSKAFSDRQYKYASAFKTDVYTPQVIINGEAAMVGSDESKINAAIEKILDEKPASFLTIITTKVDKGKVDVLFNVKGNTPNDIVDMAVVEEKTETRIGAGENMGAKLTDHNVVRNFETIDSAREGENHTEINLPKGIDIKNLTIIAYLQQRDSNKITAAAKSEL